MTQKKSKKFYHPILLPRGIARYPHISAPDTKGKYADGKYKTSIVLSDAETKALKKELQALGAKWFPDGESFKLPIKTDKKDGTVFVEAKSHKKPMVVDAKRKPIPAHVRIGGGSIIRVNVNASNYDGGINLYLEAVQVIELKQYGDPLAGFQDEDGFDADDAPASSGGENTPADEDEDAYSL